MKKFEGIRFLHFAHLSVIFTGKRIWNELYKVWRIDVRTLSLISVRSWCLDNCEADAEHIIFLYCFDF